MTIAVGFSCRDGVVIGADRQMTIDGSHTFQERKVHSVRWANGGAVFSYAGTYTAIKDLHKEIYSRFGLKRKISAANVQGQLEECLNDAIKEDEQLETLFGFVVEGSFPMLLVGRQKRVTEGGGCEIIGFGDFSLSRYLRDKFLRTVAIGSVVHSRIYAVRMIAGAKKYNGQYCGGGPDVHSVESNLDIRELDAGQTPHWEERIGGLEHQMEHLFSRISNATSTEEDIAGALEWFDTPIRDFRTWLVGKGEK